MINKIDFKICVTFQDLELLINMDYTFLIEDDIYIHIEFQTRDKVKANLTTLRQYLLKILPFLSDKDRSDKLQVTSDKSYMLNAELKL